MIDPIISLAFSLHSCKGVYALLLGSGISRAAGIPTGWEIVLDLIRKIAGLNKEDCEPDPSAWYKNKFGSEPNYSILLDEIAKSPSERNQLLRTYFEPTEDEIELGLKQPTEAHKSIARLVAQGSIRLIITTNFDRLLEKALENINITSTVISTTDAITGAMPLTHTNCTIIKVNGDYLDNRIKNTPSELKKYDSELNKLLDRAFDEFGLIVCGWSGEWDIALRTAIERCRNRRFTTYWIVRSKIGQVAQKLINLRKGIVIKNYDANTFFTELFEKASALKEIERPHPISAKIAIATAKKYLSERKYTIKLHDLILREVEKVAEELSEQHFPVKNVPYNREEFRNRVNKYEAVSEILIRLLVPLSYWGETEHQDILVRSLEVIANPKGESTGIVTWLNLRLYPALLLLYAAGIAAIANQKYENFALLLTKPKNLQEGKDSPILLELDTFRVVKSTADLPRRYEYDYTTLSAYLDDTLREPLKEVIIDERQYEKCFDRFEYLFALLYADMNKDSDNKRVWAPLGTFASRGRDYPDQHIIKVVDQEIAKMGTDWPLLKIGLFNGSIDRLQSIKHAFDDMVYTRYPDPY